jgi:hypothetical protein
MSTLLIAVAYLVIGLVVGYFFGFYLADKAHKQGKL